MTENNYQSNHADHLISVCIATYKRESLLEKLLLSLDKQELPPNIKLEIVVTDNNAEGSARRILKKFTHSDKYCYKYLIEPEKNISLARNKCVENALGEYLCFIDDDETASESWIKNLYDALIKYNADAVFGYVEPVFDQKIPLHFQHREFYFSPVGKTGTEALFYFTTNAIVKADLIKSEDIPFDRAYGLTGGEDAHLFERLIGKGAKFVVSREAISYENIPHERGTTVYLFNRALRGGQAFVRRKLELNLKLYYKFIVLSKALIVLLINSIFLPFLIFNKELGIKCVQKIGASIGKLRALFGVLKISH